LFLENKKMKIARCTTIKMALAFTLVGLATIIVSKQAWAQTSLYGHDNISKELVTIHPTTAAVTPIGGSGLASTARILTLAYHPTNGLFGVGYDTSDALYHFYGFDTATGVATSISTLGIAASSADGLEYISGSTNSLVVFKSLANNFYGSELNTINPITGTLTFTGVSIGNGNDNDFSAYDSSRNKLYTMDDNHLSIRQINPSTGEFTSHGSLNSHYGDGAYLSTLDMIFHTGETGTNLYKIDPVTLSSPTFVGSFGAGKEIIGIAAGPSSGVAPEPGTLALIALGGLGLIARRRRYKF
jgi:PEP-CTERM motif